MKNKKITFDQSTIRILYYKYKEFIIPSFVLFVCLILVSKFIIPQIEEISLIKEEEKATTERINNLKKDLNFLTVLNGETLDSQLDIASKALPPGKDFMGIINAISNSAINANVGVDDFSFAVGDLSTQSAKLNNQPSLQINLAIRGGIEGTKAFLKELKKTLPLSEVTSLNVGNSSSTLVTVFYYKPYPPIELNDDVPQRPLDKKELDVLDKISNWENEEVVAPALSDEETMASPSSD